jgi:hypothetical protein
MAEGYRESLKHPEAEELFDLGFYRPLAWAFVLALRRTPVTPNQVTMLSLAASLAAAYHFAFGGLSLLWAGAAWYALANVLDCADGQLARVNKSGTPNGRLVDGIADYIGTAAIFIGIGTGFSNLGLNLWPETVLAGLSSALHAMIFDHRQASFIAAKRGDAAHHERERASHAAGSGASRFYSGYMRLQHGLIDRLFPHHRAAGAGGPVPAPPRHAGLEDESLIRLWSFLGPTTNRTALIGFALIGNLDFYLWAVMVPGNLWLAALWYLQRRVDERAAVAPAGSAGGGR